MKAESRATCPLIRWSRWVWLMLRYGSMHIIRSGLYWRIARVTWLRNSMVSSSPPSGCRRNTTSLTPVTSAAVSCSSSRVAARSSGTISRSEVPLFPLVHKITTASVPNSLTHLAIAPPQPPSQSSGCGVTASATLGAVLTISKSEPVAFAGDVGPDIPNWVFRSMAESCCSSLWFAYRREILHLICVSASPTVKEKRQFPIAAYSRNGMEIGPAADQTPIVPSVTERPRSVGA